MRRLAIGALLSVLSACGGGAGGSAPPAATAVSLTVEAGTSLLTSAGATSQGRATLHLSDGTTQDRTSASTWTTSDSTVVRVSSAGLLTAVGNGTAAVKAECQGLAGTASITVDIDPWTFLGAIVVGGSQRVGTQQVAVDPNDDAHWYVAAQESSTDKDGGLFVTRDAGATWSHPISGFAGTIALNPGTPGTVYYLTSSTVYRSTNAGVDWLPLATFGDAMASIVVSAIEPGLIVLGTRKNTVDSSVYRSRDAGRTWTRQSLGARQQNLIVWDMAEDPSNGYLYAGTEIADHPQPYRPPFFRSVDRAETWQDATGTLPWHVIRVLVHPVTHDVYALTEGAGLYRSADHGSTWTLLNNTFSITAIVDPKNPDRFFGGDLNHAPRTGGAFVSKDRAVSFIPYGLRGRTVSSFCFNGSGTKLFAACYGSGIFGVDLRNLSAAEPLSAPVARPIAAHTATPISRLVASIRRLLQPIDEIRRSRASAGTGQLDMTAVARSRSRR
jgi:hypothetical protein